MAFGIIILVLLVTLIIMSICRLAYFSNYSSESFVPSADGLIRIVVRQDSEIKEAQKLHFYSKGIFQVVLFNKITDPIWKEEIQSYCMDVSASTIVAKLLVFRKEVVVVSDSPEIVFIPDRSKSLKFYILLFIISVVFTSFICYFLLA